MALPMAQRQAEAFYGSAVRGGHPVTLPGTEEQDGYTVQRLNIDGDVIPAVQELLDGVDPRLVESLRERMNKKNAWEGPVLIRTPTGIGLIWMIGHVSRAVMAAHGNVAAGVHVEFLSNMMAVGALVNQFSPPGPEWAPIPLKKAFKVVQNAAGGRGRRVPAAGEL